MLKEDRLTALLKREKLSGLLMASAANTAWATAGTEGCIPLFYLDDGRRYFITNSGEDDAGVPHDLADMGYAAHAVPRSGGTGKDSLLAVARELSGGRPVGSDIPCAGVRTMEREIASLRIPLTDAEVREYRWLGKRTAELVEDVCRRLEPGMTDRGVEALVSDSLLRSTIRTAFSIVDADSRVSGEGGKLRNDVVKIEHRAGVTVCAERWGIRVELTRLVHFGPVTKETQARLAAAARVNAGFWARTVPGASLGSIIEGALSDYAETGVGREMRGNNPGGGIGYNPGAWPVPDSSEAIRTPQAFAWKAAVGDLRIEDTILLDGDRLEVLTETPDWPRVESKALGRIYRSPGILVRPFGGK